MPYSKAAAFTEKD